MTRRVDVRLREISWRETAVDQAAAGVVAAGRRGEIPRAMEGRRRRFLRAWGPRGHRGATLGARRLLPRAGHRTSPRQWPWPPGVEREGRHRPRAPLPTAGRRVRAADALFAEHPASA